MQGANTVRNVLHFYPRSPCGERPCCAFCPLCSYRISIHALLAESDNASAKESGTSSNFYPRSPCGERQSTGYFVHRLSLHFYPRSPCGERRRNFCQPWKRIQQFLSTLSLRRATYYEHPWNGCILISIHALLAESDDGLFRQSHHRQHFYPRSPCGERPLSAISTPLSYIISIHALLAESDQRHESRVVISFNFYPRSPCGERRKPFRTMPAAPAFLSTLSLRRATLSRNVPDLSLIFLSTLSLRRATACILGSHHILSISIHALLAESDLIRCRASCD